MKQIEKSENTIHITIPEGVHEIQSKIKKSLEPKKIIRDPVHKDIVVNNIEVEIIDTCDFQRLRHISQLGASYLVFPGLRHTRFEHSLGTLHMAQKMITAINSNKFTDRKITDDYEILLIRLHALLHDLAHIPFGHTLEDEGKLYPSQWKDERRVERFLGENSKIGKIIIKNVNNKCRKELIKILTVKDEEVGKLAYPFAVDIVGDTICADLLDYLRRDIYFAGLEEAYDEKFLNYLIIRNHSESTHKNRVALRLIGDKGRVRRDNVSEILHLLRLRYSLGEKIYFHHAKTSASAMIIRMVKAVQPNITDQELFNLGDDEFLCRIQDKKNKVANYILERLKSRHIYKLVYKHGYKKSSGLGDQDGARRDQIKGEYRDPEKREKMERVLEKHNNLPEGSVTIYCPDDNMSLKSAEVRILWTNDKIYKLNDVPDRHIIDEIELIQENHRRLWQLSVFIAPEYYDRNEAKYVASEFARVTELRNELEGFKDQELWEIRRLEQCPPQLSQELTKIRAAP